MKSYRFTILLAIVTLILFVKPNIANVNLTAEQVVQKNEESAKGIHNFIQKADMQVSHFMSERTIQNENRRFRPEAKFPSIDAPSTDYYLSGSSSALTRKGLNQHYFLYRHLGDEGFLSEFERKVSRADYEKRKDDPNPTPVTIEYGPWEKRDSYEAPLLSYRQAMDDFKRLSSEMTSEEAEKNYIFTFETDHLNRLQDAQTMYLDELLASAGVTAEQLKDRPWDAVVFRIRYVIGRGDMRIQNAHFSLRLDYGHERFYLHYNTEFEQYNIVGEPNFPKNAPEFPVQ